MSKQKCPKCGGRAETTTQCGPVPPSLHCLICGYRDWKWGKLAPSRGICNPTGRE